MTAEPQGVPVDIAVELRHHGPWMSATRRIRASDERRGSALLALVFGLLLAGCGDGEPGIVSASKLEPDLLTIHPVLSETTPPCSSPTPAGNVVVLKVEKGKPDACLALGASELTARDLRKVVLQEAVSGSEVEVALDLNEAGTERFSGLAAKSFGQRLAILTKGTLLSAPVIRSPDVEGQIIISGISRDAAVDLVQQLGGDATLPKSSESSLLRRATSLCEASLPTAAPGAELSVLGVETAGKITSSARAHLGRTVPPWDSLPAEHFVASCTYTSPVTSSTRRCPNGVIVPASRSILVDSEGRVTDDPLRDSSADPC